MFEPQNVTSQRNASLLSKLGSRKTPLSIAAMSLVLTACGGGGGGGPDGGGNQGPGTQLSPLLAVGMQRQYVGSTTRTVTFTNSTPSNTLAYTFSEDQNVLQAPANAPGYFDIQSTYSYDITTDPGTGMVPASQIIDDYRNLLSNGVSQYTVDMGQNSTSVNIDETAGALGGGPYTATTVTDAVYTTPRAGLIFPLQAGETNTLPQSSTETITFADLNALNYVPPNNYNYGYTKNRNEFDDGSFNYQMSGNSGINQSFTENSDGSGLLSVSNSGTTTATSFAVPALSNGVYSIPIVRTVTSASINTATYLAADWYPGNAQVPSPLVLVTQAVVGPVSSLPSQCNGALLQADMVQVDTTTTNLNTVGGSYSVTSTTAYNANGVSVCTLTQETSNSYDVTTGTLNATTTTQTVTLLSSMN